MEHTMDLAKRDRDPEHLGPARSHALEQITRLPVGATSIAHD